MIRSPLRSLRGQVAQPVPGPLRRAPRWAALLAALGLTLGCAQKAPPPPARRAVRVTQLEERQVQSASRYAGSLEPRERVDLNFRVPGRVRSLAEVGEGKARRTIQEGDRVSRGQVLATLELGDFKLQLGAAAAGEESSAAQASAARHQLALAEKEAARARELFSSRTISRAELDRAEAALAQAQANLDVALGQRLARREQRALAQSAVADGQLKSPVDGIVARRMVDVGETVAPGMPAFTVIDVSEMRVVFGVPDSRVNALKLGQQVSVRLEALPGEPLAGTVTKVAPVADPQLRSFGVEVAVPNPGGALRPGMVASVALDAAAAPPAFLVPLASVVRGPEGKGYGVFVLERGTKTAALKPVALRELWGNEVEVEKGLTAGERVVVDGARLIHHGEEVEVVP